jgi:hypothetical protein
MDWSQEVSGLALWKVPLIIVGALALGYLLTKYGGPKA